MEIFHHADLDTSVGAPGLAQLADEKKQTPITDGLKMWHLTN